MSSTVEYISYRGQIHMLDGKELQYLREFQGQGETLAQALERICIEVEYESKEKQQQQKQPYDGRLDYYFTVTQP